MKKFLSLLLVIAMFTSMMVVNISAFWGLGITFEGLRTLTLGASVSGNFKKSTQKVYRFVLDKPTKLRIDINFDREYPTRNDTWGHDLWYSIANNNVAVYLPGGSRAMCQPSDYHDTSFNIMVGEYPCYEDAGRRIHNIGYCRDHHSLPACGYYKGSAELLPAGTYYLTLAFDKCSSSSYTVTIDCIHEDTYEKIVTEPTCSKAGKKEIICSSCGRVAGTEKIEKLAHTLADEWVITDATCAADGKKELFCTVCNEVAKTEKIDALPHTYGEWTVDKETSCKSAGEKSRVCSVCGYKDSEEIAALSHNYGEWVTDKEPTCTVTGERSHICSVCEYKEKEKLDKLAHTFGEWEITTQASCSSSGKQKHTCTVCGKSENETIAMLEHDFAKWEETTTATCTSTGKETRKCKNCSKTETRTLEKLDHYCDNWRIITEATCTSTGKQRGDCILCDETITEETPKLDHNLGEWTVVTEATCTKAGKKQATCADCGKTETKTISKIDHAFGEWEVTTEPSCTKTGKQEHTCVVCGKAETETIDKTEHTVDEWTITREATETRKGTRKGKCTVCGKSFSESYEKPKYPGRSGFKKSRDYGSKFSDVGKDKWFHEYVQTAYEYELANGTSNSKFSPDSKFTVAQALTAAANIHRAYYGFEVASTVGGAWYTPYVNYCIENGIIADGQFKSYDKNITRGEMAEIFAKVLPSDEYTRVRVGAPSDMAKESASYIAVQQLYEAGIVSGDAKTGYYRPNDEIVRSEACVIFTRIAVETYRAK